MLLIVLIVVTVTLKGACNIEHSMKKEKERKERKLKRNRKEANPQFPKKKKKCLNQTENETKLINHDPSFDLQMLAAEQVPRVQELDDYTGVCDSRKPGRRQGFRSSTMGEHGRPPGVPSDIPHPGLPGVALLSRAQVKRRTMRRTAFLLPPYPRNVGSWPRSTDVGTASLR